jgi:DNA-binding response OmpR family regulator
MRGALSVLLADEGFVVETVGAGSEALAKMRLLQPALVMLGGSDGPPLDLLRLIRKEGDQAVIVLSSEASPAQRARGLELGADDYVATPFDPDELTARVRAVLRRSQPHSTEVPPLLLGDLSIDFEKRILTRGGTVVPLGKTQWLVLRHLARNPGKVVLNTELLSEIWGEGYSDDLQVLRICISRLRRKLGSVKRGSGPIKTFHNVGYALEVD